MISSYLTLAKLFHQINGKTGRALNRDINLPIQHIKHPLHLYVTPVAVTVTSVRTYVLSGRHLQSSKVVIFYCSISLCAFKELLYVTDYCIYTRKNVLCTEFS